MQKTIYCCDICDVEVSYKRQPMRAPGIIAHHKLDWVQRPRENGEWALICTRCDRILRRARELAITFSESSDTIYIGGPFHINPASDP